MRGLVYDSTLHLDQNLPRPDPASGEALIRVHLAGICATDLEITRGYMNYRGILGHEFVGDVVEGPAALRGRRVVAEINCVCGRCDRCAAGLGNHCRRRTVIGIDGRPGAFAEFLAVPAANCHLVPDSVSDEEAVFVEPLAAALQVSRQVKFEPRHRVVVLGAGRLGLLVAQVLVRTRCRLVVVARNRLTLDWLDRHAISAAHPTDASCLGDQDVVIDCTGSPDGLSLALRLVRPRGTIVLKTTCAGSAPVNLAPLVVNEVSLVGSRCGPFPDALALLARKEIDVLSLVTHRATLSDAVAAFALAEQPNQVKVLIDVRK